MFWLCREKLKNLLSENPETLLEMKESSYAGAYVKDLSTFVIKNTEEMREKLDIRRKNQITIPTNLNEDASKASCILTITLETTKLG